MDQDEFWKFLQTSAVGDDPYEQAEAVQAALSQLTPKEVVDFDQIFHELHASSYSWRLWGAAYLINGGCSDDGFDYFRGWLILQGRRVYESALDDPDSLAKVTVEMDEAECEDILYATREAYESITGKDMRCHSVALPELGEGWDFDNDTEMKHRYPRLFAKFCDE